MRAHLAAKKKVDPKKGRGSGRMGVGVLRGLKDAAVAVADLGWLFIFPAERESLLGHSVAPDDTSTPTYENTDNSKN
ncbi:unnamed protein product, partial [Iphiclides podalirius]